VTRLGCAFSFPTAAGLEPLPKVGLPGCWRKKLKSDTADAASGRPGLPRLPEAAPPSYALIEPMLVSFKIRSSAVPGLAVKR
jgi:hypothetical protein